MNRETNRDRVLNGVNRVPQNMDVPWEPIELRQFWAMARAVGMSKESVYNLIGKMFVIGLLITLIVIVCGVVYKFGTLEKSVEYLQKTVAELNIRMNKIEDKVNNSVKRE